MRLDIDSSNGIVYLNGVPHACTTGNGPAGRTLEIGEQLNLPPRDFGAAEPAPAVAAEAPAEEAQEPEPASDAAEDAAEA